MRADRLRDRLRWPAVAIGLVYVYGVAGFMVIEDWTFVDALYMTFITLSTVGFREVQPLDTSGKLFTISLIVFGVTIFLVTLTLAASWFIEFRIGERWRRKRMERVISRLKDHFIICAFGRVGRAVAREFDGEKVPYVVIDLDEELEEHMVEAGVLYLIGDPSKEETLREAGIERARGLVCAVDSDATNVFITLMARAINPQIFVVTRAADQAAVDRLRQAGADRIVSPYATSGHHMAMLAQRPRVVGYMELATARDSSLRVDEVQIEADSPLEGQTLSQACRDVAVLAVGRQDGRVLTNPHPATRLEAGDLLVLMGREDQLRSVEEG
ncbi:MAG TPA: potassium channel protein [Actinomycetota bacterium]